MDVLSVMIKIIWLKIVQGMITEAAEEEDTEIIEKEETSTTEETEAVLICF
jgi:hypothetical protein